MLTGYKHFGLVMMMSMQRERERKYVSVCVYEHICMGGLFLVQIYTFCICHVLPFPSVTLTVKRLLRHIS